MFSVVGTANNLAIRDTLGELCVPNIFAATGSPAWGNPDYPWTIGSTLSPYTLEAEIFAELLEVEQPGAKVAMLVQDDDFGAAYEEGFEPAIEGTERGSRSSRSRSTPPAPARSARRSPASPPAGPTRSSTAARCWPAPTP